MWVADDRVEEYKAAGHIPVAESSKMEKPIIEEKVPKKTTTKKTTKRTTKKD